MENTDFDSMVGSATEQTLNVAIIILSVLFLFSLWGVLRGFFILKLINNPSLKQEITYENVQLLKLKAKIMLFLFSPVFAASFVTLVWYFIST